MKKVINGLFAAALLFCAGQKVYAAWQDKESLTQESEQLAKMAAELDRRRSADELGFPSVLSGMKQLPYPELNYDQLNTEYGTRVKVFMDRVAQLKAQEQPKAQEVARWSELFKTKEEADEYLRQFENDRRQRVKEEELMWEKIRREEAAQAQKDAQEQEEAQAAEAKAREAAQEQDKARIRDKILIKQKIKNNERVVMPEANLSGAQLDNANLENANLSGAYLDNAKLAFANLSGANLSGANLSGAYLYYANLSGADLTGAILSDVDLTSAKSLTGANLSGAIGLTSKQRLYAKEQGALNVPLDPLEKQALATLGLPESATNAEIKKQYRTLAMKEHPDKHGNSPESTEKYRAIKEAYEVFFPSKVQSVEE